MRYCLGDRLVREACQCGVSQGAGSYPGRPGVFLEACCRNGVFPMAGFCYGASQNPARLWGGEHLVR